MNFDTDGWGQPFSAPGSGMLRTSYGGARTPPDSYGIPIVSEQYYTKIAERVQYAQSAVARAESGKRITNFREGPNNAKFFQAPINDSDAYAHVAYWLSVAAMATGNRGILNAASQYADSANTWSNPFFRMKTGGVAKIYRGGMAALRRNAGQNVNDPTVKYVTGIFTAQGNPAMSKGAQERALLQDPVQMASGAVAKTLTTKPQWTRLPWWAYAIAGTAVLGTVLYLTAGARSAKSANRLIRRRNKK
tara:strand:- start:1022 stop:1765 length:744 start_codon:yes stop_codon:yes gene_type:complete